MSRSVMRAAGFPPPRRIGDTDFEIICTTFGVVEGRRQEARAFLDKCATAFADAIANQRALPPRKNDRLCIARAAREIGRAIDLLNQAKGPAARSGLQAAEGRIGTLVSASWMRRRFPDNKYAPAVHHWPQDDNSTRSPERIPERPIDIEDLSLGQRIVFAKRHGRELTTAVLAEIVKELDDARQHIVELPDGRKPFEYRNYLMAALAELWSRLGKHPTTGMRSRFGAFCESVFDALGWPTEGVNAALSDAIATWRELYRR